MPGNRRVRRVGASTDHQRGDEHQAESAPQGPRLQRPLWCCPRDRIRVRAEPAPPASRVNCLLAVEPAGLGVKLARSPDRQRNDCGGDYRQRIPLPDASIDTALCTWSLCTISDPVAAVHEVSRVRRPEGRCTSSNTVNLPARRSERGRAGSIDFSSGWLEAVTSPVTSRQSSKRAGWRCWSWTRSTSKGRRSPTRSPTLVSRKPDSWKYGRKSP